MLPVEQSLMSLLQRLHRDTGLKALHANEASVAAAAVTDVLLQSHTVTTRALTLAMSCLITLATFQAGHAVAVGQNDVARPGCHGALRAAGRDPLVEPTPSPSPVPPAHNIRPVQPTNDTRCQPPNQGVEIPARLSGADGAPVPASTPVVLPLLPLLTAVVVADDNGAEAALRRLNRRLGRPFSAMTEIPRCPTTTAATTRASRPGSSCGDGAQGCSEKSGSEGGDSAGGSGLSDCTLGSLSNCRDWDSSQGRGSGSGRSSTDGSRSSRLAASTATYLSERSCCSSLLAAQQAEAQLAREAESCRAAAARLCGRGAYSEAATAEVESIRGACVAALAAAAADIRCHQELLHSPALEALPWLLRCGATSPYAAVLVHNLAAPPSASFRAQLRRRGVLPSLLDYMSRLLPSSPLQPAEAEAGQHLRSVRGGQPEGATRGGAVDLVGLSVALAAVASLCAGREGVEALRQPALGALKRLAALRERLLALVPNRWKCGAPRVGGAAAGCMGPADGAAGVHSGQPAGANLATLFAVHDLMGSLLAALGVRVEQAVWVPGPDAAPAAAAAEGGKEECDGSQGQAAAECAAEEKDVSAASLSFQSKVMVDGRLLDMVSVITRTTRRRPDGSEDVHYQFQDQVAPNALPGEELKRLRGDTGGCTSAVWPPWSPAAQPHYQSSSSWVHAAAPGGPSGEQDAQEDTERPPEPDQDPAGGRTGHDATPPAERLCLGSDGSYLSASRHGRR
ncbi:hypothetical protein PLESTB_000069700 [Pleodorina starrii]|uniref:Uncharacterized protein n=1 Tax=Pleodorina starrii TaxID=330485 RepID=A0A9W6B9V4_9CHLO|nr:hypothetical protein PLESTB_000069700 [Pleodorina starrii]